MPRIKRKFAIKKARIHITKGHYYKCTFFKQFTFCSFCKNFIWGLNRQGFECKNCKNTVHKHCVDLVLLECKYSSIENVDENEMGRMKFRLEHNYKVKTYLKPTFCDHCGTLIYGLINQGLTCKTCKKNIHKRCLKNDSRAGCGIDQHILSDAIAGARIAEQQDKEKDKDKERDKKAKKKSNANKSIKNIETKYNLSNFVVKKMIGEGSFGKVFIVSSTTSNVLYAMKVMRKDVIIEADDIKCAKLERDILSMGHDCKFLTCLKTAFQTNKHLIYIMEYLAGGDLMFHFEKSNRFTYESVKFYSAQVYIAVRYLHEKNILYRDLKMDNILMALDGNIKLADFGMCRMLSQDEKAYTFCGTPGSMAPEIISNKPYRFSVDIWSFGVLVYEMYTGLSCFEGDEEEEIFSSVLNNNVYYPDTMELDLKEFIQKILTRDVEGRNKNCGIKGEKICNFEFFSSLVWDDLNNNTAKPPFKPKNIQLGQNFDNQFTQKAAKISNYKSSTLDLVPTHYFEDFDITIENIE